MKIAYLMNAYPMTSTTFIRREIEALESLGMPVHRHAVRTWEGRLVDPRTSPRKSERISARRKCPRAFDGFVGANCFAIHAD